MSLCNGCGECCTIAAARPLEVKAIRRHLRETGESWVKPAEDSLACGFLRRDEEGRARCAVYEVRPFACRAFGVIEEMECGYFPEAVQTSIPARTAVLMRWTDPSDQLLGEAFEGPGYGDRIAAIAAGRTLPVDWGRQMLRAMKRDPEFPPYGKTLPGQLERVNRRAERAVKRART